MLIIRSFILSAILSLFVAISICLMSLFHKHLCVNGKVRVERILQQEAEMRQRVAAHQVPLDPSMEPKEQP